MFNMKGNKKKGTMDGKEAHQIEGNKVMLLLQPCRLKPPLSSPISISLNSPCMCKMLGWMESLDDGDCCDLTCMN
ncbi:unknown protein [Oryza sativa Japonica Group]|uniref:Uncharacterized protein n=1 Tax=Oryza sativa subsp. japonica TaxID=39947 RepID=Q5QMU2_ORYSJ|nr:unknown protein [Oryza sativa Japonica Group]BAD73263.1 unknown protein [Oryza sativa Japonica Group]